MFGIKDFDDDLMAAIEFAVSYHGDQMYGDKPYLHHLMQVAMVLPRFGFHPSVGSEADQQRARNLIMAAVMHDVVEDTMCTYEDVAEVFGEAVSELVYAVSNEPGKNRRERHEKSHDKLIKIEDAIILKLADRIANAESCRATNSNLLDMYRREWGDFKKKLKSSTKAPSEMWDYLELLLSRPQ
jgi:guanosine-3',5'-bis(diphosphate) 3'-pyrophosphohydrolase